MRRQAITAIGTTAGLCAVPPPPLKSGTSLFLDLDGTLLELIDRPDQVVADENLRGTLGRLHERLEGRVAIVSGRSLAQLDSILGPVARLLALSGSHGGECRVHGTAVSRPRPPQLDRAAEDLRAFARHHEGMLLEEKTLGVALHYRLAPQLAQEARRRALALAERLELFLQEGSMMVELRPRGHDKGTAISHMMEIAPLVQAIPVFAGDDLTDEAGFAAARDHGGYGILIGKERPSAARYRLRDPAAVRAWLREFAG